ncbi:transglutaminase-like domain-containing protein [Thermococcus piezophilus]|uniref:transglutaminase-like domain-containing protein n=1 Tax=Thermococcus piezophilus TaxID=1712654 RepID=UPI0009ED88BF
MFGHVAVGVKIGEKLYILDQRLPSFNLDTWLMKWNKKKTTVHKLKKVLMQTRLG